MISKLTKDEYDDYEFDFNSFIPMPREIKGIVSSFPNRYRYFLKSTERQLFEGSSGWDTLVDADGVEYKRNNETVEKRDLSEQEVEDLIKQFGAADWYDWFNTNVGTKWGYYDQTVDVSETEISINANSAWCPAKAGLINISKQYPDVTITNSFAEQGMGYMGTLQFKNGEKEMLYWYEGEFYEEYEDDEDGIPEYIPEVGSFLVQHGLHAGG